MLAEGTMFPQDRKKTWSGAEALTTKNTKVKMTKPLMD
jgi:hypothetical protein